jgi:hypothetical protein
VPLANIVLPASLFERDDLGKTELRLIAVLRSYADRTGRCFPGIKRLVERLKLGARAIQAAITKLAKLGLLSTKKRGPVARSVTLAPELLPAPVPKKADARQQKLPLDEPPQERTADSPRTNPRFATMEEGRGLKDPQESESRSRENLQGERRRNSVSKIEIHPFGSKAAQRVQKKVGPVVKANIARQWEMKLLRFLQATGAAGEAATFMEKLLTLDVNDKAGRRALMNPIDARMRERRWDDMREWKDKNRVAMAA